VENPAPPSPDQDVICPCRGVTRDKIVEAAPGARSFEDLCRRTGAAVTCFGCALEVEELYGRARTDEVAWTHRPTATLAKKVLGIYRRVGVALGRAPLALLKQASWYVHSPDLKTRLVTCNLSLPNAADFVPEKSLIETAFYSPEGRLLARKTFTLDPNQTLSIDVGDLLGSRNSHGLVVWRFLQQQLGCSRSYVQWYSANSVTCTHEKYWGKGEGYFAIPKVPVAPEFDTHWITVNPRSRPYSGDFVLTDGGAEIERRPFTLPGRGSQFVRMDELFPTFRSRGEGLTVYLDGPATRVFCYYLVHNRTLGTWQTQHL
jgi:bacterioferritin-associated ferredoxin